MELAREIAVWACIVGGSVFCVIGGIGLLRMPDFYTRSHAASITDTLGATLILVGLALVAGPGLIAVKLFFVLFLIYVTSPTAAHALVKAAYSSGLDAPDVEEGSRLKGHLSDDGGPGDG